MTGKPQNYHGQFYSLLLSLTLFYIYVIFTGPELNSPFESVEILTLF